MNNLKMKLRKKLHFIIAAERHLAGSVRRALTLDLKVVSLISPSLGIEISKKI